MKQTLINKYLAGETNISEERELKQLLLDIPDTQQSKAERSILELLSYSESEEVEEDIFAVDYTEEYDKHVRPSRTIRLWPWFAAACVAALLVVFLAPPRENTTTVAPQIAKVEPNVNTYPKENNTTETKETKHLAAIDKTLQEKRSATSRIKSSDSIPSEPEVSQMTEPTEMPEEIAFEDRLVAEVHDDLQEQMQMCDIACFNDKLSRRGQILMASLQENKQ